MALEHVVQQRRPSRLGEQLGAEADQPAGRDDVVEADPPGPVVDDLLHPPLAQGEQLGDHAEVLVGDVDRDAVDRFVNDPVDLTREHLGLADGELEALPPHHLHEHGELQLAAALDLPGVGALGGEDADADVADELGVEAALDESGGQLRAVPARQRRRVDPDRHRQARVVDRDDRQRTRVVGIGERLPDRDLGDPGDGDDLAGSCRIGGDAVERLGGVQLGDARPLDGAVGPAPGDGASLAQRARPDAAEGEASDVWRGIEVGDECLQRHRRVERRGRDAFDEQVEQRRQRESVGEPGAVGRSLHRRPALAGHAVDGGEVELVDGGVEVEEQLLDVVDDLGDAGVGAVDLVDHEDHRQLGLERLAQHEAGLGERPLAGVDEQEDAVDHRQCPLDLAAEVGVPGGVDDVDRHRARPRRRSGSPCSWRGS